MQFQTPVYVYIDFNLKKKKRIIQRAEQSRLPLSTKASMECDLIVWEFFGANWTNHLKFERKSLHVTSN